MKKCIVLVVLASICTLVSQNAMAGDLGFKSLGVSVGMVSPEDLDATFGAGVFMNHGFVTPEIKLESRIDFWSKSEDLGFGEVSVRDIAVGARGKYMFPTSGRVLPFAGAGLGLHFLNAKVDVPPQFPGDPGTSVEDSDTKLGVDIGGGLEMPMNPKTDFVAEAWYGIVSDFSQFSLRVGMAWKLGQ
jgi:opacity protein-like surface antigen